MSFANTSMQNCRSRNGKQDNDEEEDSRIFPQKVMEMLSNVTYAEAICWLPHGKAFVIRNRDLFAEIVMPKFFSRKAKYSSFMRKLKRWNFSRVSKGSEMGAYYNEFFCRDKPQLVTQMFCQNARTKLAMAKDIHQHAKSTTTATETFVAPEVIRPSTVANHGGSDDDACFIQSSSSTMPTTATGPLVPEVIHPSIVANLGGNDGVDGCFMKNNNKVASASVWNQLLQQGFAQQLYLQQHLAMKEQMDKNNYHFQQVQRYPSQQPYDAQAMMRFQQLMNLRSLDRKALVPNNGRASAA